MRQRKKGFEHMAEEGGRLPMNELVVLFKDRQDPRKPDCPATVSQAITLP